MCKTNKAATMKKQQLHTLVLKPVYKYFCSGYMHQALEKEIQNRKLSIPNTSAVLFTEGGIDSERESASFALLVECI